MPDKLKEQKLEAIHHELLHLTNMVEKICASLNLVPNCQLDEYPMTVKEAAAFLRMEEPWIRERCKKGSLPFVKTGKQLRFKKEELMAWVQAQDKEAEGSVDDYVNRYLQNNQIRGY